MSLYTYIIYTYIMKSNLNINTNTDSIVNKETQYSLNNIVNYRLDFDCDVNEVIKKYAELMIGYFRFIIKY